MRYWITGKDVDEFVQIEDGEIISGRHAIQGNEKFRCAACGRVSDDHEGFRWSEKYTAHVCSDHEPYYRPSSAVREFAQKGKARDVTAINLKDKTEYDYMYFPVDDRFMLAVEIADFCRDHDATVEEAFSALADFCIEIEEGPPCEHEFELTERVYGTKVGFEVRRCIKCGAERVETLVWGG